MNIQLLTIFLIIYLVSMPVSAAKIYKWEDKNGVTHISSQPPRNQRLHYQTIISVPSTANKLVIVGSKPGIVPLSRRPAKPKRSKTALSKENVIVKGTSKSVIEELIVGAWSLIFKGGGSQLTYFPDGKFQYKNKNKRATFTHKGKWRIYQKRDRWFLSHKGKYFTKTRHGKTSTGAINDLYILKKLSGKKLVLLEAKYRKHINDSEYELGYFR